MRHPFELLLSELKTIDFQLEELSDEASEQVAGGFFTTQALGEEGGNDKPSTKALGEEGGATTLALGEEGGNGKPSTKALGEEGGSNPLTALIGEQGKGVF